MKNFRSVLWGLVILLIGIIIGLNALEITDIDIFFDGWWTLFIIVPCFIDLFRSRDRTADIIGLVIGITLLLACNDVISFSLLGKLIFPVILVIIGIKLIIRAFSKNDARINEKINQTYSQNKNGHRSHCVIFSGDTIRINDEPFSSADLTAIFGGIDFDLRNAIIESNIVINAVTVFGGIDIFIPKNVQLIVRSSSIFGGVGKKTLGDPLATNTVFINASCVFGGIDIK